MCNFNTQLYRNIFFASFHSCLNRPLVVIDVGQMIEVIKFMLSFVNRSLSSQDSHILYHSNMPTAWCIWHSMVAILLFCCRNRMILSKTHNLGVGLVFSQVLSFSFIGVGTWFCTLLAWWCRCMWLKLGCGVSLGLVPDLVWEVPILVSHCTYQKITGAYSDLILLKLVWFVLFYALGRISYHWS